MDIIKTVLALLFILISYSSFAFDKISILADSIPKVDTLNTSLMKEVEVVKHLEEKVTGLSMGKIVFDANNARGLPALLGNTNLLKLLELTPGVQNSGDANTNLYIRGGDSGQNLLLYDDAPMYTPGHLLGFFPLFNADHITSLEMNKSGISARNGGRLSSVLEVKADRKIPTKSSIKGNVGLLSSQLTVGIPIGDKFGLKISGRKSYIELLMQPILNLTVNNKADTDLQDLTYRFYDTNLTLIGKLSDRDVITLDAILGEDRFGISDSDFLINGTMKWSTLLLSAKWMHDGDNYSSLQQVYFSSYRNKLLTTQAEMDININSDIQDIGYKSKYVFTIGNYPIETGIQYSFYNLQPQTYDIVNINAEKYSTIYAHGASVYVASNLSLTQTLSLDWGLRYSAFINKHYFQGIEPRIKLYYRLKDDVVLRASYDRNNQYLNMLNPGSVGLPLDFWSASSSELPPQSGDQFSLGYYQSFNNDAWEVSGELFYRLMNNVNEYDQVIIDRENRPYTDNVFIGEGKAYGLEVMLKKNYGRFSGWLSYTIGRSERSFPDLNEGKTFPAKYDRRHDLSLVSSYSFSEKWDLSLVYTYATGNAYTLPSSWYFINGAPVKEYGEYNGARMPDYNRTDISLNYWFEKDNGLNFSVYNLFMVDNPIYLFMNVRQNEETGNMEVKVRQKKLYTIMPSISWRFKF